MKKFFIALACVFTLTLTSCSKSPASEVVSIINQTTKQIEKAQSAEEMMQIARDIDAKMNEMESKYSDYKPTEKDEKAVNEAYTKLEEAVKEAEARLGVDMDSLW